MAMGSWYEIGALALLMFVVLGIAITMKFRWVDKLDWCSAWKAGLTLAVILTLLVVLIEGGKMRAVQHYIATH